MRRSLLARVLESLLAVPKPLIRGHPRLATHAPCSGPYSPDLTIARACLCPLPSTLTQSPKRGACADNMRASSWRVGEGLLHFFCSTALLLALLPGGASSPSPPPPLTGLHLSAPDAKVHLGTNMECTLEFKPGPPPYLESNCPIDAPPPHPSSPPPPASPPPPPPPPPSSPPLPPLYVFGGAFPNQGWQKTDEALQYNVGTDTWTAVTSMTLPDRVNGMVGVNNPTATVQGNYIYVLDGIGGVWSDKFWRYNLATESWDDLANFPVRGYAQYLGAIGGKIYAVGGRAERGQFPTYAEGDMMNHLYEYDPSGDSWTQKAGMAHKRFFHCAVVLDGLLYAMGGIGGGNQGTTTMESYDPASSTWTSRASMPIAEPKHEFACAAINGRIYVAGGLDGDGSEESASVEVFTPGTDTWTAGASLPSGGAARAGVTGSTLFVAKSGHVDSDNEMWRYDDIGDSWTSVASIRTGSGGATDVRSGFCFATNSDENALP